MTANEGVPAPLRSPATEPHGDRGIAGNAFGRSMDTCPALRAADVYLDRCRMKAELHPRNKINTWWVAMTSWVCFTSPLGPVCLTGLVLACSMPKATKFCGPDLGPWVCIHVTLGTEGRASVRLQRTRRELKRSGSLCCSHWNPKVPAPRMTSRNTPAFTYCCCSQFPLGMICLFRSWVSPHRMHAAGIPVLLEIT